MKSVITYHGGGAKMLSNILPLIPEHITYCEPFAGGGSVFFEKNLAKKNYLNDKNGNIASLYDCMAYNFDNLKRLIQGTMYDEFTFKQASRIFNSLPHDYDTEIANEQERLMRAWATWVCSKMGFGGKLDDSTFAWSGNKGDNYTPSTGLDRAKNKFEAYRKKMQSVIVFNRDALEVIKKVDSKDTFFYIDPPWIGTNMGHYKGYTKDQFKELIKLLADIKGKFILHTNKQVMQSFYSPVGWNEKIISKKSAQSNGKKLQLEQLTFNYSEPREQLKIF